MDFIDRYDERFVVKNTEGNAFGIKRIVLIDRATGVNYLYVQSGYSGGLTPLYDADGKILVTPFK